MICGVKPIPAEPESHSPSKTVEFKTSFTQQKLEWKQTNR